MGVGGGGVGRVFMHGRNLEAIDPRIPAVPGRSKASFHESGKNRVHEARSAVGCWVSRAMKDESCILLRFTCDADFGILRVLSCVSDDSFK